MDVCFVIILRHIFLNIKLIVYHNLFSLPNVIRMIKSRRMTWAGHVVCMGEERNA
jgi:hypothetical protein